MATLRFLPQTRLDEWTEKGKADPRPDKVVDLATRTEFPAREAVHFVKVESGQDASGLLNKVKTLEQVKALGGEHYMTSVILGETVYEVVPGWLAEDATPAAAAPGPGAKGFEAQNADADALAQLLLGKMS